MDNLCHTLVGAAMGEAGLKSRTAYGNAVLMLAANLPDIDVFAFVSDTPAVALRRGWTHGVLAQALLPVLMTGAILAAHRMRPPRSAAASTRAAPLLLLCYAGVVSHVMLDWLNAYGVRLLMPFSGRWFYGDSVFVIDPWLWLSLGTGVYLARRYARTTPARVALLVATAYTLGMLTSALAARRDVLAQWTAQHGAAPAGLMVGPVIASPFHRAVILDEGDRYHTGTFRWRPHGVAYDGEVIPSHANHPAVVRAREHPDIRAVLVWARFPYYELAPVEGGTRVTLRDMRFGSRVGSVTVLVPDR
jgi:inner membrane protein